MTRSSSCAWAGDGQTPVHPCRVTLRCQFCSHLPVWTSEHLDCPRRGQSWLCCCAGTSAVSCWSLSLQISNCDNKSGLNNSLICLCSSSWLLTPNSAVMAKKSSLAYWALSEHCPQLWERCTCACCWVMGHSLGSAGLCTGGRVQSVCGVGFFLSPRLVIELIPFCHQRNVLCTKSSRAGSDNENHSPAGSVTSEIKDQR